jgi:uncharacterized repeat protein (TIGR01451 family)
MPALPVVVALFLFAVLFGAIQTTVLAAPGDPVIINELDADQSSTDTAEFIELFDGGSGSTPLDGMVLVFYNGNGDTSYRAIDLDGFSTDAQGYFVAGNSAVTGVDVTFPNDTLQNGQDAVALYTGNATDFPNGTAVTTANLLDAVVYDTNDADDPGLLILLNAGQPQVDENGGGNGTGHSIQRCPNGSGGARNTDTYTQLAPTPGTANCPVNLGVSKSAPGQAQPGSQMTYTLVVNASQGTAQNVLLTDTLPTGLTYASVVSSGGTITLTGTSPAITWQLGNVAPGAPITINLTVDIDSGLNGIVTNQAEVSTTSDESDLSNNTASAATYIKSAAPFAVNILGSYATGITDGASAEIAAHDPATQRLFVVNGDCDCLDVLDISNPITPTLAFTIPVSAYGGAPNSVASYDGVIATAVEAITKTLPGAVVFFDADGNYLNHVTVGALPDMLTFTHDGQRVVVANEGEMESISDDPEGSVSIIDLSGGVGSASVSTASFSAYNTQRASLIAAGVRILDSATYTPTVAQDLEPEYIAISGDDATAWVTLQENNAVAVVNIATATVTKITPLGLKDFSRGLPTVTTYEWSGLPHLGTTAPSTTYPSGQDINLGGFSGLFFEGYAANGNLKFITHPDRGPNGEPTSVPGLGTSRPFPLPDFQPMLVRFEFDPTSGAFQITEEITLTRSDGVTPLTGLPNLRAGASGLAYTDEIPVDLFGNQLPFDEMGGDLEGIVVAGDGTFWMVDEYRPAIYHFDADGVLLDRFIAEGTAASVSAAPGTYGTEVLPAVYAQRRANRGFEAVALEGDKLYAFIQSPLDNPDLANDNTSKNSRVNRIVEFDVISETVTAEYIYLLNDITGSGTARTDKIGDAVALGNGRFLVVERDDRTGADGNKLLYEIDLTGATDIHDPANLTGIPLGQQIEQLTPDGLAAAGIQPVYKRLTANVAALGYTGISKLEGLARIDANTFALLNDNDFGVEATPIPLDGTIPMSSEPEPILLGLVSFDQSNGLDASDRDGPSSSKAINIANWPVFGMYMPDGIHAYETNGETYYITANEGDDRNDFLPAEETLRVGSSSVVLDPAVFTNSATLKNNANLGRLNISSLDGDLDGDGDYDRLQSYGARSFTIRDASGNLVFDSGDLLEQITAAQLPAYFNADDGDPALWDTRSDNKGPEPESVEIAMLNGRIYAFIAIERAGGGAIVFDVTDPTAPVYTDYLRRDGDIAPEGVLFIAANDSPTGRPLLVLANEFSGTTTLYELAVDADLQLSKDAPAFTTAGGTLTYTIVVTNASSTVLENVIVTDTLPAALTYISDNSGIAPVNPTANVYEWHLGSLEAESALAVVITTTVAEAPTAALLTNEASASTTTSGDNPADNEASAETWVISPVANARAGSNGQTFGMEGQVIVAPGTFSANEWALQDASGGIAVYYGPPPTGLALGDMVRLVATRGIFNNQEQMTTPVSYFAEIAAGPEVSPIVTTTAQVNNGHTEGWLVQVAGTVSDLTSCTGSYDFLVDDGSSPVLIYVDGDTGVDVCALGAQNGSWMVITGFSTQYQTTFEIKPRRPQDVTLINDAPGFEKSAPALVQPGAAFTYTLTLANYLGYDLTSVVITDRLPANSTFAWALEGGTLTDGVVSWTLPDVADQSQVSVRFVVTATQSDGVIINDDYQLVAANFVTPTLGAPVFTVVTTSTLSIHHIQGMAHRSPFEGLLVTDVPGIVTAVGGSGFYMQEPNADANPATSEGIYVYTGSAPGVNVGDAVEVDGRVVEFRPGGSSGQANLTITELTSPVVTVLSSGNPLPAATLVGTGGRIPPTTIIDDDANGNVEISGTFDPATDGIDFYESLEGMRIALNDAQATGPTNAYGEIPVVGDQRANVNTEALTNRGGVVIWPGDDYNPERLILDDTLFANEPQVNVGDVFSGTLTGVLDYSFGNFKLLNTAALPEVIASGLVSETTTLTRGDDQITIATFNVENLDPGDGARFDALADEIVNHLLSPDIVAVQEIQDNDGETNSGETAADETFQALIAAISAAGGPAYDYRQIDPIDLADGGAPGGNIRVGFLFRSDRGVEFVDRPGGDATTPVTATLGAAGVELSFSPGRLDPENAAFNDSRKPLAGEFTFNGHTLIVIANHLNSKGGDQPLFGRYQPPALVSEAQRVAQAQVIAGFVGHILSLDPHANVVVLGDMNDFQFSLPLTTIAAAGLHDLVVNLAPGERYTYVYDGNAQVLDHILATTDLPESDLDIVHMNAEFTRGNRPTDHDPMLARFTFEPPVLALLKTVSTAEQVAPGSTVTYTIHLTNTTVALASGIVLTDVLPVEVSFGGWLVNEGATEEDGLITWEGSLAGNDTLTLVFTATVSSQAVHEQVVTNVARYAHAEASGLSAASFTVYLPPVLTIEKTVTPEMHVAPGSVVTYTIELTNTNLSTAAGVLLTDTLPAEVRFGGWLVNPGATEENGEITWHGSLAGESALTLIFTATVSTEAVHEQVIGNTARYGQEYGSGQASATFAVYLPPALSIEKSVTPDSDVTPGSTVTYTISLNNTSPTLAAGITLTDVLPAEVSFGGWVVNAGAVYDDGVITWQGSISGQTALTLVFTATVSAEASDGLIVSNTAHYHHASGMGQSAASFEVERPTTPPVYRVYLPIIFR